MSVYHFHDAPSSAQRVLFGGRVTVVTRSIAEFGHLRGRREHERGFGLRIDQVGRVDGITSSVEKKNLNLVQLPTFYYFFF